jgi:hypothetical protein
MLQRGGTYVDVDAFLPIQPNDDIAHWLQALHPFDRTTFLVKRRDAIGFDV